MVFILRPSGGHTDGVAYFSVQPLSCPATSPRHVQDLFPHFKHSLNGIKYSLSSFQYQLYKPFSYCEIIFIFISLL